MPDQTARQGLNTPEPTAVGRLRRRARLRILAVTLVVLLVLTGLEVGIRVLPPDAVQVRASTAASEQTLAMARVTDNGTVADLYARINSLPTEQPLHPVSCTTPPNQAVGAVTFEVVFMRWGLPIEDATLPGIGCGLWGVSQGGLPSVRDPNGQTQAILSELHTLLPAFTAP
jgi:hypothetical protein